MSKSPFRVKTSLGILDGFADDSTYQSSVGNLKRGDYYYNTSINSFRFYNGSVFQNFTPIANRAVVRAYDLSFSSPPSGTQTVDSVSLNIGDLVLLTSTPSSGIYKVQSGTWTLQAIMQDSSGNAKAGDEVRVTEGSSYGNKTYIFNGSAWVLVVLPVPTVQKSTLYGIGANFVENTTVLEDSYKLYGAPDNASDSFQAAQFTINASDKTAGTGNGGDLLLRSGTSFGGIDGNLLLQGNNIFVTANSISMGTFSPTATIDIRTASSTVQKLYGIDTVINGLVVGVADDNAWVMLQQPASSLRRLDFKSYRTGVSELDMLIMSIKTSGQVKFWPLSADPIQQESGDLYYNSIVNQFKYYNGTSWQTIGSGSGGGLVKVDLYDSVDATLPLGVVVIDGVTVTNNKVVLFSNLGSGNNQAYKATVIAGSVTSWSSELLFSGISTPTLADEVIVRYGTAFANQIGEFNGTTWLFNNTVRFFKGTDYWEQSALFTINIANNSTANIFSVAYAGSENMLVDYSIIRGTAKETGTIMVTTDGMNVAVASDNAGLSDSGVSFSGSISGSNLVLSYTSTNTGQAGTMKFSLKRWSDIAGGPGGPPSYTGGGGSSITGSGSNGQIAYWTGASTMSGNANYKFDSSNLLINKGILEETIMSSAVLTDNNPSMTPIFTLPTASYNSVIIHYSITRGSNSATGRIMISTDGVTVAFDNDFVENNSTGITIDVDISGSNLRVLYMSTNTGSNATFKWTSKRWL